MIDIDELVLAIQRSAIAATEAVAAKNLDVLNSYFEQSDVGPDIEESTKAAIDAASRAAEAGDGDARLAIQQAVGALQDAVKALGRRGSSSTLRPKTAAIEYPIMTKDGPSVHVVHVPLISLAPMRFAQLAELRISTDLELSVSDQRLRVGFAPVEPSRSSDPSAAPPSTAEAGGPDDPPASGGAAERPEAREGARSHAKLELVVRESPTSAGLRLIIEGYERALRAQVPG